VHAEPTRGPRPSDPEDAGPDRQPDLATVMQRVRALVDEYRVTCLWSLREDYYPTSVAEALRVLDAVERHGDVTAFKKSATLRAWLSRHTSAPSAAL
jgi:hypothetical protein